LLKNRVSRQNKFIISILILQSVMYYVIYAEVLLARIILGLIYLLFVPGILILKLLAIKSFDLSDKVVFSLGLSLAFLMFAGLLTNSFKELTRSNPFVIYLLISAINTILLLYLFTHGANYSSNTAHKIKIDSTFSRNLISILLCICPLVLGSYGIFVVNCSGNNFFILLLIIIISIIISLVFVCEEIVSPNYYPFLLLVVFACFLLFMSGGYSFVTPYIIGLGDQWTELHAFQLTKNFWNPKFQVLDIEVDSTYSMVSVTVLPSIFSRITGLEDSILFKLLYPVVVSFVAICAYKLYQTQVHNDRKAFLATFFLITISAAKGVGSSKQEIAQLFYSLIFLVLFRKDIPYLKKIILTTIFSSALVISHYGLSYIFLFIMVSSLSILTLLEYLKRGEIVTFQIRLPFYLTLFFSVTAFSWYIFVCGSAVFNKSFESLSYVMSNLNQFFNLESRGTALQGLGFVETPTIFHRISAALFILTEILLSLGFIKSLILKSSIFDVRYKVFATLNFTLLALNLLLPGLADTFLMDRFYQNSLIILAPLAVVGGEWVLELVLKRRFQRRYTIVLALLIFIPLYVFQTELIFELTHSRCWAIPLVKYRTSQEELYRNFGCIDSYYYFGTKFLDFTFIVYTTVYSDSLARYCELRAYTTIYPGNVKTLSNVTQMNAGDFVYLNPSNTIGKKVVGDGGIWNVTDLKFLFDLNKIYSNGGSEIYKKP